MTFPLWSPGERVNANKLNQREPITIMKTGAQTWTNNTTFAQDTELFFTAEANSTYIIDLWCWADGDTTGDIKIDWVVPTGAGFLRGSSGPQVGSTDRLNTAVNMGVRLSTTSVAYGTSAAGGFININEHCWLQTTSSGLTVPRYAQNANSGTATNVNIGSHLTYLKVA